MSKTKIPKFLMSAFNMVKRGDIKNIDDLFKFAKQEFGEITSSLKNQIEDTFKKGQAAAITEKRTKDMSRGDPTGEGLSQFRKNIEELKKQMEELDKLDDRNKDITKDLQDALTGQIFKRPMGSTDATKPFKTPGMPFQRENPNYRLPGGSMYAEGNLRTAIRKFLETEINEGRLTVTDKDKVRVMEYSPFSEDDPIDVFRRYYGETALDSADKMASKLQMGESFSDYERIFRENMPELKIKTEGAGQYDQSIADAEAALKQGAEDKKNLEILEDFDVEGRKKNNMGGINRASFASGKIKLAVFLAGKGKNLTDEIRKAVDNIFPSGDRKVDADMALDDMYENLGINRDAVDMKDDMNAYGEAYDLLSVPRGSRGGPDDIAAPFSSEKVELPEGVKAEDTILPTGNLIRSKLKTMEIAEDIQPGLFENLTDKQREIIEKYGDLVDRDLLKNIVLDPDPNNQAAALATLEEAKILMDKGMGTDEIIDTLRKGSRTEQAEGGLSYLMGM
jgi:hypothetical protein